MGTIQLIDNIKPYPYKFDENDWDNPTGVQRKTELTIFRDCDTIPLLWQFRKGRPYLVATRSEFYDKYWHRHWFHKLSLKLYLHFGYGKVISALFARLNPYGELKPHVDGGKSVVHNHNIHIPITTNEECIFTVGNESENLKVGNIYEVDNTVEHSVVNGSSPRIHLIVEWYNPLPVRGRYEDYEDVHGEGGKYRIWKKR